MRERGVASAARAVRFELAGRPSCFDRSADGCVALRVRCVHPLFPVGSEICLGRKMRPRCGRVARCDFDVELGRVVADLGEPEALLVDEIERKLVRPRWDRASDLELAFDALTRSGAHLVAQTVPDDRIAALVEPVVGEVQAAPGRAACVLEREACTVERARLRRLDLVGEPADRERAGRYVMLADRFQCATSLRCRGAASRQGLSP